MAAKSLPRGLVFIAAGLLLLGVSGALVAGAAQLEEVTVSLDSLAFVQPGSYVVMPEARLDVEAAFPTDSRASAYLVPIRVVGDTNRADSSAFAALRARELKNLHARRDDPVRGSLLDRRPAGIPESALVVDLSQTPDNLSRGGMALSGLGFFLLIVGLFRRILASPAPPEAAAPRPAASPEDGQ